MKKLLRNKKGFTLIELIVVILILAVLAAILVPSILNYVGQARDSRDQANARQLYSQVAIEQVNPPAGWPAQYDNPIQVGDTTCEVTITDDELVSVDCNGWVYNGTDFIASP